jgi:hypothetical protein
VGLYDAQAVVEIKRGVVMSKIRWRLVMGLASLLATLFVTAPAVAPAAGRQLAVIWPNGLATLGDIIWPNGAVLDDIIWPNGIVIGDSSGS